MQAVGIDRRAGLEYRLGSRSGPISEASDAGFDKRKGAIDVRSACDYGERNRADDGCEYDAGGANRTNRWRDGGLAAVRRYDGEAAHGAAAPPFRTACLARSICFPGHP